MRCEHAGPILALLSVGLFSSSIAHAQTAYDPRIAYTQHSGQTSSLFMANADGSHAVKIASGTAINAIDFAPGGGRMRSLTCRA